MLAHPIAGAVSYIWETAERAGGRRGYSTLSVLKGCMVALYHQSLSLREFRSLLGDYPLNTSMLAVLDKLPRKVIWQYRNVFCDVLGVAFRIDLGASRQPSLFPTLWRIDPVLCSRPIYRFLWDMYARIADLSAQVQRLIQVGVLSLTGSAPLLGWADRCVLSGHMTLDYAAGEFGEFFEAIKARDIDGMFEEWEDACICTLLGLIHRFEYLRPLMEVMPVPRGLGASSVAKFAHRRLIWKHLIFPYHGVYWFKGAYLREGGNYLKTRKIARALQLAWGDLGRLDALRDQGAWDIEQSGIAPSTDLDQTLEQRYRRLDIAAQREKIDINWVLAIARPEMFTHPPSGRRVPIETDVDDLTTTVAVMEARRSVDLNRPVLR
jgi:hypothetical protein